MNKKSLIERIQPYLGVARHELVLALYVAGITLSAMIYSLITKPNDTFNAELNSRLSARLDSLDRIEQKRIEMLRKTGDTLKAVTPDNFNSFRGDTTTRKPMNYRPESEYKKKELPTSPININTANKEQLMQLPGVGDKMADKIIAYRKTQPFATPEQLMEVSGIGEKKFDSMQKWVKVK
jgi:competence ComEA-like helix-hairpin-helix protein